MSGIQTRRKRGIRASRSKLDMAMLEAGIRTQCELADKIAERENRPNPPRDTINRAFREEPVSPATLSRIALVLGVTPDSLYLDETASEAFTPPPAAPSSSAVAQPAVSRFRLAVHALDAPSRRLAQSLIELTQEPLAAILLNEALIEPHARPADLLQRYQADGVLTLRSIRHGRHLGLQAFLYRDGQDRLLWSAPTHEAELSAMHLELARGCLSHLLHGCGLGEPPETPPIPLQALDFHLQARSLLEEHLAEINLKRAQTLLREAIEACADFARSHAALAESLLQESWMGNERKLIEEATGYVNRAIALAPDDVYVQSIHAYQLRRSAGATEALSLCRRLVERQPDHVDALSALANASMLAYEQNPEAHGDALDEATRCLTRACRIEPGFWRHHFELGNCHVSRHDMSSALRALQSAVDLKPNEASLLNLGTLYRCHGDLEKAEQCYRQAGKLNPDNYAANDLLATLSYYREDYDRSARLKQRCLDTLLQTETTGLHQMWGELADALRHLRRWAEAVEAYHKAVLILERDQLSGYAMVQDDLYKEYYLLQLHRIDPERHSKPDPTLTRARFLEYLERDFYPSGYVKLAQLGLMYDWPDLARKALDRAAAICPGFRKNPDLKALNESCLSFQQL